ncbi:MAG: hypothetical protein ITD33_07335 [Nitrosarchaeum sp.]|nr:hypothetical protein [Nitrosarchaeum sp.]
MDLKKFIEQESLTNFPIGLGGCRATNSFSDSCDYDITVFDETNKSDKIVFHDNNFIKIHYGSLKETKSDILIKYNGMQIIHDESWELRMFLSKINEKHLHLYNDYAKNCLFESIFCCEKTKDGIKNSNVFSSCWQICASYFLADAICLLNLYRPNPTHMLDAMRKFGKNKINEEITIVNETIGIERATQSLLERKMKSTIGFSNYVGNENYSKIIKLKHDLFIKNSMLPNCYFYLGYVNKENFVKIKDSIDNRPDLIHILRIAFDIEADSNLLEQQAKLIQKSCNSILGLISSA